MPRLPVKTSDDADLDPTTAAILGGVREENGHDVNVYGALANHPAVLMSMAQLSEVVYFGNSLPPAERELTYLATSVANECFY